MRDQAEELRNLVLRAAAESPAYHGPAPQFITLTGAKSGVGVTTMALGVSVALAQQGTRVVLVDADAHRPDIAARCGINSTSSLSEIYAGRRTIHEVLQRGPAGLQLVPGGALAESRQHPSHAKSQERVVNQLRSLGKHVDTIVVDVGSRCEQVIRTFWEAAQQVVVVTTPETTAIMDCYSTIKGYGQGKDSPPIGILVNQTTAQLSGINVHNRIDQSCRRFLKKSVSLLGAVPQDATWHRDSAADLRRFNLERVVSETAASLAIDQIASLLADSNADPTVKSSAA